MSQTPQEARGSRQYSDGWRAINVLIRSDGSWSGRERNLCYRNNGNGGFVDEAFVSGLDLDADGRAFVPIDLDGDGDLDLLLISRTGPQLRAFRNDFPAAGARSLIVRVRGAESNREGVGARLVLETDQRTLLREIVSASGYLSQRPREAHFGLGDGERAERLRVRWPGGAERVYEGALDQGFFLAAEDKDGLTPLRQPDWAVERPSEPGGAAAREERAGTWLFEPVPAPDFALDGVGGEFVRLGNRKGNKTLVNVWATWCAPCRTELADFQARYSEFEEAGAGILAVSVDDPQERAKAAEFAAEYNLPFPVLFADDDFVKGYSVLNRHLFDRRTDMAIPTSFLVDEAGGIVKVYRGAVEAERVLADLRAGPGDVLPFEGSWIASGMRREWVELATAFAEQGLTGAARMYFETAVSRGVDSLELLNNYAALLVEEEEFGRAEELLRRSFEASPNQTEARLNLASIQIKTGRSGQAEEALREILNGQPDDAQAHELLGAALFAQDKLEPAAASYRRAAELEPENATRRYNLGAVLAAMGRFGEAAAEMVRARELGLDSAELYTNLGVVYMQQGMRANARLAFEAALEADPEDAGAHLNMALYRLQAGDGRGALEAARTARTLAPGNPAALMAEAQAHALLGDPLTARRLLEAILRAEPGFEPARALLEQLENPR